MSKDDVKDKEVIDALYLVIDNLEENPIQDLDANDTMIEILSRRIETIMSGGKV